MEYIVIQSVHGDRAVGKGYKMEQCPTDTGLQDTIGKCTQIWLTHHNQFSAHGFEMIQPHDIRTF